MIKCVCDICGKNASEEEFIIPSLVKCYATRCGVKLCEFSELEPAKMNLCSECRQIIAKTIDNMRGGSLVSSMT